MISKGTAVLLLLKIVQILRQCTAIERFGIPFVFSSNRNPMLVYYLHISLRSVSILVSLHIYRLEKAKQSSKVASHTLDRSNYETRRVQSHPHHESVHPIQRPYECRDGPTLSHTVQVNSACLTGRASFLNLQYTFCLHYYYSYPLIHMCVMFKVP